MATSTDEIDIDIDAIDAEATKKAAEKAKSAPNGADPESVTVETTSETPKPADKPVVTPEEGLEKLRKQLADERTRAETERARADAAEQRATEASHAEAEARGKVQTSQLDLIKGAIDQLTQSSDTLESRYAEAAAAGDWAAAAKVQREMAVNAAKLTHLEAGKTALEKAPKPTPRVAPDPVEHLASQLTKPSADWVRAHPEFARDAHKNQQMIAAHQLAIARGHKPDSDEYFKSIEKTLDITPAVIRADPVADDPADDPMAAAAQPARSGRNTAPAAAPVSRSGNGAAGRPNVVKLTPAEVEIAGNMGMSVEEYARNKVALRKEGKLS